MPDAPIPLIAIVGPTAAGKTRLAACVAAALSGEVLSADSRQVYRGMNIGTGKDLDDYVVAGKRVPAHLIDIADPGEEYNVYAFKRDCLAAIRDVHARRRLPVLCGGSGLYLSAVLQDYPLLAAPPDARRRERLEALPTEALISELRSHRALHNTTDTRDRKRLIRAIEIAEADPATRLPSVPLAPRVYGVRWERAELRRRITQRLARRLEQGLIEEVRALLDRGLSPGQLAFYGLEYRHVTDHVCGATSREEMFAVLERAIHRFAKRQATWFRRMERQGVRIHWLDGADPPEENSRIIVEER